jgi:hypothetical protein
MTSLAYLYTVLAQVWAMAPLTSCTVGITLDCTVGITLESVRVGTPNRRQAVGTPNRRQAVGTPNRRQAVGTLTRPRQ